MFYRHSSLQNSDIVFSHVAPNPFVFAQNKKLYATITHIIFHTVRVDDQHWLCMGKKISLCI